MTSSSEELDTKRNFFCGLALFVYPFVFICGGGEGGVLDDVGGLLFVLLVLLRDLIMSSKSLRKDFPQVPRMH